MKTHAMWMIWRREIKYRRGAPAYPCPWTGSFTRRGAWEAFEDWLGPDSQRYRPLYFAVKGTFMPVKTKRGGR